MTADTDDFSDLLDTLNSDSYKEKMDEILKAALALRKHVTDSIKARQFTITGDTSHPSIQWILNQAANIDKPRKYKWQDENVHEEEFLRSIKSLLPDGFGVFLKPEEVAAAISGESPLLATGRFSDFKCYDCAKPVRLVVKGTNLHLSCGHECENNGDFFVDIDFPTGEVVFADWPDRFSEIRDEGYLDECDEGTSINYIKGQRERTEGFAKQGIFHLSVGNTCPSLYINPKNNRIRIGKGAKGYQEVGTFCTDLWWVTMLDKSRYDEMVSKLPAERNTGYYKKNLEIAKVKPGRYRFYAVPRPRGADDDGYASLFAKAEYLGPCGEVPKVQSVEEGKIILTPRQFIVMQSKRYPTLYRGQLENVRFSVMDQTLNVIGNGIRSKGEFLSHISVPAGTQVSDVLPPENAERPKYMEDYVFTPYPNFNKQYSLVWRMPLAAIPTAWLEEAVWFYGECQKFFAGPDANNYSYAYPPAKQNSSNGLARWQEIVDRRRAEGQDDAQLAASMTKDYEVEYRGDLEDFLIRRWAKEKAKIDAFITETLTLLHGELTSRTGHG